ncbi:MAG: putative toxin-antitoxin system toxin component, PIN family [Bacteroidota bacterium]|nr:putative toxin-antitoxin system toxin component, PIN family [Bacteroidota bacterium]
MRKLKLSEKAYIKKRKPIRVVVDTYLWISFLIGKRLKNLQRLITENHVIIVISDQILEEIEIVTKRPKISKYFPENKVIEFIAFLKIIGITMNIKSKIHLCRDDKDNFLLSLAKDGKVDYLVTGDKDLLDIGQFEKTEIIDYNEFEKILT